MDKKENKEQLGSLTHSRALGLSRSRKRNKLQKAGKVLVSRSDNSALLFDNLITVEELAVIFRVSPQTIRNWVARGKIPHIQIGRRNLFHLRRLQQWLIQKEEPQWR